MNFFYMIIRSYIDIVLCVRACFAIHVLVNTVLQRLFLHYITLQISIMEWNFRLYSRKRFFFFLRTKTTKLIKKEKEKSRAGFL